jgi:hypothetical protein
MIRIKITSLYNSAQRDCSIKKATEVKNKKKNKEKKEEKNASSLVEEVIEWDRMGSNGIEWNRMGPNAGLKVTG